MKNNKHGMLDKKLQKEITRQIKKITFNDSPSFPLAMNTEMPEGFLFNKGHISFNLSQLGIRSMSQAALESNMRSSGDHDATHLTLSFKDITLHGAYTINAKYAPEIELDTAGTMMEWNDPYFAPAAAGANESDIPDEQKQAYLDQAREQRTRLMDKPNGQKLMEVYNEHNEVYNGAFQGNGLLRRFWKARGATAEMAADTSEAVKNDGVINQKDKRYKNRLSYNANAFTQQLNVAVASVMAQPGFDIYKPIEENKYTSAGLAALSFGKAVNATGNNKSQTTELTSEQVHASVDNNSPDMPQTSLDELGNVVQQGMGSGGAAEEARDKGWIVLDEEDREHLRYFITGSLNEKEEAAGRQPIQLWIGRCEAILKNVSVKIKIMHGAPSEVDIDLPAFDFDVDDRSWSGKTADLVRERLSQIYFVRCLIHDQVLTRIKSVIQASVANVYTA